jgi:hypothetical protein
VERDTYYKIAIVLGAAALSTGAFSKKVRQKIWERDKGQSVWTGETENLTAAHINHNKSEVIYNSSENGRLLTQEEQYVDHFNRHKTAGIGLTEEQNNWALRLLWGVLGDSQKKYPPPEEAGKKVIPIPKKKK